MEPILLDVPGEFSTERLFLRRPRVGDSAIINPVIVESVNELALWMPWATPTPDVSNTEQWVRRSLSKFHSREQFDYLMFLKSTDTYIGTVGIPRLDWHVPKGEIGYWLRTSHVGKGYMAEAVRVIARMALEQLKMQRVEIRCDERNARSRRVAELAGFKLEGIFRNEARETDTIRNTCVYSRIPSD
jgi:RimJ/RimL family protein N-acetyltransferase